MESTALTKRLAGTARLLAIYVVVQTSLVVAHEFAHSTTAWLLGYTATPLTVIWGNPLTVVGWDEGVPYDRLFPLAGNRAEALIGGMPLLMHLVFVSVAFYFLRRPFAPRQELAFLLLYWFAVINLAELIAYIVMRPFTADGDTGRFNEGMNWSPWVLFLVGLGLLLPALWVLARRLTPKLAAFTDGSWLSYWTQVTASAFILFLWGSGLRLMARYPDPQWQVGLVGIAGFIGWLLLVKRPATQSPPP